jgi:hypothetical protein
MDDAIILGYGVRHARVQDLDHDLAPLPLPLPRPQADPGRCPQPQYRPVHLPHAPCEGWGGVGGPRLGLVAGRLPLSIMPNEQRAGLISAFLLANERPFQKLDIGTSELVQ